ncbi:MAG: NB-ARC domain-containing protein [Frankia sp.]
MVDRSGLVESLVERLVSPGGGSVSVTAAVEGAGGFGKTTLAAAVCARDDVRRRYPGGLVWTTIGESAAGAELAALVNDVCEMLTGNRPATSDAMVAGAALGSALDSRADTLVVLDDVWTTQQLAPFLVGGSSSRRLVTTRNRGLLPRGTESVLVDAMSRAEAAEALQLGLIGLTPRAAERLLEMTGGWPVLLGLVNAAILDRVTDGASPDQAAQWVETRLASDGPTALDVTDDHTRNRAVASTIGVSLHRITSTEQNLYTLLAIFPEDVDIPADILALLWGTAGQLTASQSEVLRERLVRLRLVTGRWVDGRPAVRLHDVLRDYLRRRYTPSSLAAAHRTFLTAARTLIPASPDSAWWSLPEEVRYLWRFLPWHLREAGANAELTALLEDLRWTLAKTEQLGTVVAVEADLNLADSPIIRKLRRVAAQNAHILTPLTAAGALGPTLLSRLVLQPDFCDRLDLVGGPWVAGPA